MNTVCITYNEDRRSGMDRREFSYTAYLPERRSGKDRRDASDHRSICMNERGIKAENDQCRCCMMY
jgi:hypothetical protein